MKNLDLKKNNGIMDYEFHLTNELVFDVGLNTGQKSEEFLSKEASVIGFEPQKDVFETAIKKLSNNNKFIGENIALSSEEGEKDIYISDNNTVSSMSNDFINRVQFGRFRGVNWSPPTKIKTSTLDLMIKKYGKPKYIKIDVEGYEFDVLKGLSQPVEYISIEFTPELYYENTEKCLNYIYNLYNKQCLFNYVYRNNDFYMFTNWQDINQIKSYLSNVKDFLYEFGDIYIKCTQPKNL